MTNGFRIKYASLITALLICLSKGYADPCTLPCSPCEESCSPKWWASADLLYLRASEEGFGADFGTTTIDVTVVGDGDVTTVNEINEEIDFHWNLGFRLGAGYGCESSCWNPAVYWTHFNETGKGNDDNNHAKWKLKFNEIDAVIAYQIDYSNFFSFKPFFGARYAQINQTITSHLEALVTNVSTGAANIALSTLNDHQNFWGAGPVFGFEGAFDLGRGFSVYGNLAGNILYGQFKVHFNDSDLFTVHVNNSITTSKNSGILTGYDLGLGMRYIVGCASEMPVTLQLGLEQHSYCDYNQLGGNGDLNLYGFNLSANVQF